MDRGIHRALGQFPRLAQMTHVGLGVGGERKPKVRNVGLAREPLSLSRHRRGIGCKKRQSVESVVDYDIIQLSRLGLLDQLSSFVKPLQGK